MNLKKIFCISLITCLTQFCFAQESKFSFGVGGGLNITNISGTNDLPDFYEFNNLTGYRANVLLGYKFSEHVVMFFEPGIEQKGYKTGEIEFTDEVGNDLGISAILIYITNYVTFPLTLNFTTGNKIKFNLGAGIYTGVITSSKVNFKPKSLNINPTDLGITSEYSSFDYGATARSSFEIKLISFLALEISGNYSFGLTKINKGEFFSDKNLKNRSIFAGAGVRFYFAGKSK